MVQRLSVGTIVQRSRPDRRRRPAAPDADAVHHADAEGVEVGHTGLFTGEWYSAHLPRFRAGLPSSALPAHVAPAGDQSAFDLTGFFESGLQLLLDGVAVLLGRQRLS